MPASFTVKLGDVQRKIFKNSNQIRQFFKKEWAHLFPEYIESKVMKLSDCFGDIKEVWNIFVSFRNRETVQNLVSQKFGKLHYFISFQHEENLKNLHYQTFVKLQFGDNAPPPLTPPDMRRETFAITIDYAERDDHRMKTSSLSRIDDPSYLFRLSPAVEFCPPSKKVFSCLECRICKQENRKTKLFYGEAALRQHFTAKHKKTPGGGAKHESTENESSKSIICRECSKSFNIVNDYLEHFEKNHEKDKKPNEEKREGEGGIKVKIQLPESVRFENEEERRVTTAKYKIYDKYRFNFKKEGERPKKVSLEGELDCNHCQYTASSLANYETHYMGAHPRVLGSLQGHHCPTGKMQCYGCLYFKN